MSVNLYESQKRAVENLHSGSILHGDVGSGKTRTALAYFATKVCGAVLPRAGSKKFKPAQRYVPLYVITTARKRDTRDWEDEAVPFLIDDMTVDSWNNIGKYVDVHDAFFIFDEQRLVGSGAWVKSFYKIAKHNEWILLSATPGDVWMDYIPVFIANGFYKSKTEFINKHVVFSPYVKYPKVKRYLNTAQLEAYRSKLLVELDSNKKATRHVYWVKTGYDADLYDWVTKTRRNILTDRPMRNRAELCYTERWVCNSDPGRIEALNNIFKKHRRLIVFYNFDYELEELEKWSSWVGVTWDEYNGHRHGEVPEAREWIYLVQYTAASEAWNCITTDTIVFFSMNYSYRMTHQSMGRIDRTNTEYTDLNYFFLFSDAPIDKAIRKALMHKKRFNESSYAKEFEPPKEESACVSRTIIEEKA